MDLFVLRHGPAADFAFDGGDADRPLTDQGRARVASVARAFAEILGADDSSKTAPLRILASPFVRALSTAEIVANTLVATQQAVTLETRRALVPGGNFAEVLRELRDHGPAWSSPHEAGEPRVLLVSHEPTVSELLAQVTGRALREGLGTATLVALSTDASSENLHFRIDYSLDGRRGQRTSGQEIFQ